MTYYEDKLEEGLRYQDFITDQLLIGDYQKAWALPLKRMLTDEEREQKEQAH